MEIAAVLLTAKMGNIRSAFHLLSRYGFEKSFERLIKWFLVDTPKEVKKTKTSWQLWDIY